MFIYDKDPLSSIALLTLLVKKVKIKINGELISDWERINTLDPEQGSALDKLLDSINEFNAEIVIARHSSDSIEYFEFEDLYEKSDFALQTESYNIQDKVAMIAIEIFKDNNGRKKSVAPKEIKNRYFEEYREKLKDSMCTKGLKIWKQYFIRSGGHYKYNFILDQLDPIVFDIGQAYA